MKQRFSKFLDHTSEFLAARKGLLPIIAMLCILLNFLLRNISFGWLAQSDLFLHLGIILAILGFMLAWAL